MSNNKKMLSTNLPEDLLMTIMERLPVKSLLRFKCVAKSWYALITDPSFITKHLKRSNSITKNHRLKIIFQLYRPDDQPPCIFLISKDEPDVLHDIELPLIPKNDLKAIFIYGQCDGIFLLHGFYDDNGGVDGDTFEDEQTRLILWNPSTKEVKTIPASPWQPKNVYQASFGFGIDPITKDYKVVQFSTSPLQEEGSHVEVFSLSTNSWRTIINVDVPDYILSYPNWNSYMNGVHHWLACERNDNIDNALILSFDFSEEVFRTIQLPSEISSSVDYVGVVDERLTCLGYCGDQKIEIWVMNEYGVESSWTKKFEIGSFPDFGTILGFWGDNEILVQENQGGLISYNLQNQHIQEFQTHPATSSMFDYVESLVPLTDGGKHTRI